MARTSKLKGGYDPSLYKTSLYRSWYNMKTRCLNKNASDYNRYGARGIRVCDEWMTFAGFLVDMRGSYQQGTSIDRINNNGSYCKANCRWATPEQQANNRRSNHIVKVNGETMTMAQSIKQYAVVKRSTVSQRYFTYGWTIERALMLPVLRTHN